MADSQSDPRNTPLGLPEPPAAGSIKLDVTSNEAVALDHLGPMVVNIDGTISQITNWDQMTEAEKKNTMRMLQRRNKQRLDALKQAEEQEDTTK
ncbi:hypothetical protein LTR97_006789 [Elasticomyces elasticus]|uniref:Fungal specific transcription n=1 Tax=Elasticomyces elasticus TaxID=574655 RepID=A0AAN7WF34_9PEZI|nr:hypothetical protein LTR97_006789 [Elasticomyces elasticus]